MRPRDAPAQPGRGSGPQVAPEAAARSERSGAVTALLPDWADVLASALVGVERRPVHSGLSTVDDSALGLLDAAAVLTAYRRAGVRPVDGVRVPSPAPDEAV